MSDEIEYIEPTQEHVGQMVEVKQREQSDYRTRKLLAVLPHPIKYRFVCQDSIDAVSSSHWFEARIARPKPQPQPEPNTKPIDWTKPVRTKLTKWPVTLVTVKGRGDYPVVGYVGDNIDLSQWNLQGNKPGRGEDPDGLENAPQRIQREYWVNVYEDRVGCQCKTQVMAKDMRENGCLACVKITIDCEEGEGL